jgi:hypothetical protein
MQLVCPKCKTALELAVAGAQASALELALLAVKPRPTKVTGGACLYGTQPGSVRPCTCTKYHSRGKSRVCGCGHERAWHTGPLPAAAKVEAIASPKGAAAPPPAWTNGAAQADEDAPARRFTGTGEMAMLGRLVQWGPLSRADLTTLTGYKRRVRDRWLKDLIDAGKVHVGESGLLVVTAEGRAAAPDGARTLPCGLDLQRHYTSTLPASEAMVLNRLILAYPSAVSRNELSDQTGFKRRARDRLIRALSTRNLVVIDAARHVKAHDLLFRATPGAHADAAAESP